MGTLIKKEGQILHIHYLKSQNLKFIFQGSQKKHVRVPLSQKGPMIFWLKSYFHNAHKFTIQPMLMPFLAIQCQFPEGCDQGSQGRQGSVLILIGHFVQFPYQGSQDSALIRVVRAHAFYKESGEQDFSHSRLDCHCCNILSYGRCFGAQCCMPETGQWPDLGSEESALPFWSIFYLRRSRQV